MDPFEARLQFSKLLSTMQPSSSSLQRCVTFALRNREYQEDFGSCILESLDNNDLSTRLNILNFVDALITTSINNFDNKGTLPFVKIINENLPSIISKVVPNNRQGLYNMQGCYAILRNISLALEFPESKIQKYSNIFKKTTLLSENEKELAADVNNIGQGVEHSWRLLIQRKSQSQSLTHLMDNKDNIVSLQEEKDLDFTDDEILSRMEADRERHKKTKEHSWVVERPTGNIISMEEFKNYWDNQAGLTNDDLKEFEELNAIALQSYNYSQMGR